MTNPQFFTTPGSLNSLGPGDTISLGREESRHAINSMRLTPGEALTIADGHGTWANGTVHTTEDNTLTANINTTGHVPQPQPRLVLVQALAKGDRDLLAIQTATEIGVDAIVPWQAERSIARIKPDKKDKTLTKWRSALTTAAKQARRPRIPELWGPVTGANAAQLLETPHSAMIVLHEDGQNTITHLTQQLHNNQHPTTLYIIVGPEGGITDHEMQAFNTTGATPLRIGDAVFRTSTAGPVALTLLNHTLGRW